MAHLRGTTLCTSIVLVVLAGLAASAFSPSARADESELSPPELEPVLQISVTGYYDGMPVPDAIVYVYEQAVEGGATDRFVAWGLTDSSGQLTLPLSGERARANAQLAANPSLAPFLPVYYRFTVMKAIDSSTTAYNEWSFSQIFVDYESLPLHFSYESIDQLVVLGDLTEAPLTREFALTLAVPGTSGSLWSQALALPDFLLRRRARTIQSDPGIPPPVLIMPPPGVPPSPCPATVYPPQSAGILQIPLRPVHSAHDGTISADFKYSVTAGNQISVLWGQSLDRRRRYWAGLPEAASDIEDGPLQLTPSALEFWPACAWRGPGHLSSAIPATGCG